MNYHRLRDRWLAAAIFFVTAVTLAFTAAGCGREDTDERQRGVTALPSPEDALSEELILALSQARNFHHKADVYLRDANLAQAIASIESILTIRFPAAAPEAEDVLADARARLAKLLVTAGEVERAMTLVDEALSVASRQSFFVANLHTVRGEIFEAKSALVQESDPDAAKALRLEAIKAYDRSIAINEALQKRLFDDGRRSRP